MNLSLQVYKTFKTLRTQTLYLNPSIIEKLQVSEPESKANDKQSRPNINSISDCGKYDSIKSRYISQSVCIRLLITDFSSNNSSKKAVKH